MQDEINEKVVALSVKGAKLTAEMLQKAIKAMLAQAKKQQEKQPHGKQTLKQLAKQNAGLSNIEITEGNIKAFEQTAKTSCTGAPQNVPGLFPPSVQT